ncbi:Hpt domain-containing protein [Massilia sp. W12]|uniref:Hpt domain-containing protein n=1 Tax=Massilia sp. W12 TaxID=3126507 RepID=UPI0030D01618
MDQIQAMLQKLRDNYLAEMPDRLEQLESLVLSLERGGFDADTFHELYRQVHSLKGSGGTYGLHVLTAICHPFEDFLSLASENQDLQALDFANISLEYLDIMRHVTERLRQRPDMAFDVDALLARVRKPAQSAAYHVLLVENSSTVIKLASKVLQRNNFHISVEGDGYQALGRALSERFDLLLTAQEVRMLNGGALIAALKLNHMLRLPKLVLMTANPALQNGLIQPDYTLCKDDQLSTRLDALLKSILSEWEAA